MPRTPRTRPVTAAQVRAYLATAGEYALAAQAELDTEHTTAATSLAIHAAINAVDAVTATRLGQRSAGQDHDHVPRASLTSGPRRHRPRQGPPPAPPLKTKTEYDPDAIPHSAPSKAVERAHRCVAIARRVVASRP